MAFISYVLLNKVGGTLQIWQFYGGLEDDNRCDRGAKIHKKVSKTTSLQKKWKIFFCQFFNEEIGNGCQSHG